MKSLALFLLVVISVQTSRANYDYDNFVEDMMVAQNELFIGHFFFQENYYNQPAYFAQYLHSFNSYMVTAIGRAVDYGNQITVDTYRALEELGARDECEDLWATYQARYGRTMQTCSEYGLDEIQYMVYFYDFLIWWSQYSITNDVQTHAMAQFTYWNPLTYPEYDVLATIKNEFRLTLDEAYKDYIEYIEYFENQFIYEMDHIIRGVDNCAYDMVYNYETTASVFLFNAEAGRC